MHLVADISGHGLGHLAQAAPVLNALAERVADLRITVRSTLSDSALADMTAFPFERAAPPPDIGMEMNGPIEVDRRASAGAYAALHSQWDQVVAWETDALERL